MKCISSQCISLQQTKLFIKSQLTMILLLTIFIYLFIIIDYNFSQLLILIIEMKLWERTSALWEKKENKRNKRKKLNFKFIGCNSKLERKEPLKRYRKQNQRNTAESCNKQYS